MAPIDDTPAARAGVKAGDLIVAVDGKPLTPAGAEGQGPLRGEPGSTVKLTIVREGEPRPLQISVTRGTIKLASVRGRMLEPGYRSEEHTSELQSLMRISYAVFC